MIVPRYRVDELRDLRDRMLAIPTTLPDGYITLADMVARAVVCCRPITVAELKPGHALAISARADLEAALACLNEASVVLGRAGSGDAHDAAVHALRRLTAAVDKVAAGDLTAPFRWDLDLIAEAVDRLNPVLDQGRRAMTEVLSGIGGVYSIDLPDPVSFERARAVAVAGACDCVEAYEHFDQLAVRAVREADAREHFAIFRGGHDPFDPLAVLVR
ncbi:methyl-accepting chemotaxis protein [Allocatelliglobosispora scoriae]|uniref:Methyl-accepting chemotaxis protein n=1 Tax=Allocatelliglobosispora scoriae TaxID=643052 RepID=A0A841C1Q6_9ACTN|nr:hypothetical protein [Allocatelliglobosispora scoriae]MBB5872801.1 methyl-accepting chemotaxis protein [Allocatelliglobosispora scoriae]